MLKKQEILIGYFRQGKSKHQLSNELQISRNTVKRYIAEYENQRALQTKQADFVASGIMGPPKYDTSQRKSKKLTDEAKQLIKDCLRANEEKARSGKSKQQMAGTDILDVLLESGHQISYSTVIRYVRTQKKKSAEVFIRQHYEPGQAVEFDWGMVKLDIGGITKNIQLAVFTSSYSNHRWAKLFYRQDMTSFLEAHASYFEVTKHVPDQMVYDNMRVAVRKFAQRNVDKQPTEQLLSISMYYQFEYRFCNARRGNEKGHVERSVEFVRRKAFSRKDSFDSLDSANQYLEKVCFSLNKKTVTGQTISIEEKFQEEVAVMNPSPLAPYDTGELRSLKVDKYSCVRVDTNQYSVQEGYVGEILQAKIYPNIIVVYNADNQVVATHSRRHTKFEFYLILDHFLNAFKKKPGALLGSVSFAQASQQLQNIFNQHFKDNPKMYIDLLLFVREKQLTLQQLQASIERSIKLRPNHPMCLDSLKLLLTQKAEPVPNTPLTNTMSNQIATYSANQLAYIQNQFSQPKSSKK